MRDSLNLLLMLLFAGLGTLPACAGDGEHEHASASEPSLQQSTQRFLNTLAESRRESVKLPMDHDERTDWTYFPGRRKGVSLAQMNPSEKNAFQQLLRSGLSTQGYLKANGVIHLEEILGRLSGNPEYRDPEKYYTTVFGAPASESPWGVRVEGHHLSLNYTAVNGRVVSVTPAFFGANPAVVPEGSYAGMEVLADEQRVARRLFRSLDKKQTSRARFRSTPPHDILTGRTERAKLDDFAGLPASELNEEQKALLKRLIRAYTGNFPRPVASRLFDRFTDAGPDRLHFAWAGSAERGEPHYYRIQAPGMIIEYANTQDGANHAHTVLRDYDGDFGRDKLAEHLENSPHHQEK